MKKEENDEKKARDAEQAFIDCFGFLRGFLDMLYNTCLADDGLENTGADGLMALIIEAKHRLEMAESKWDNYVLDELFSKLQQQKS
ncbi:MAG: hypothetical protein ABFD50_13880 [Smithella sp.]